VADNGHQITVTARLGAQNAEAILTIVEGDALDKARSHFLGRWFGLRLHADPSVIWRASPSRGQKPDRWSASVNLNFRYRRPERQRHIASLQAASRLGLRALALTESRWEQFWQKINQYT
jgi:hypothetical protein